MDATSKVNEVRTSKEAAIDESSNNTEQSNHNARTWSKAKIAVNVVAGIGLGILAVASLAMLVFLSVVISPAVGEALIQFGATLGPVIGSIAEWAVVHSLFLTIYGAVGLGLTALGTTGLIIFNTANRADVGGEEGSDSDSDSDSIKDGGSSPDGSKEPEKPVEDDAINQ